MLNYSNRFLLIVLMGFISQFILAQGNTCENPIPISDPASYCSSDAEFNTSEMTPSNYDASACFSGKNQDIWFVFTAGATDATITIRGNTSTGSGGSMISPEASIYSGECGGTLELLECSSDDDDNLIELRQGGLFAGVTYFIRIQSGEADGGSFQICMNNFNPPVSPGSDCFTASILCDKSTFTVDKVSGAGIDVTELNDASCFNSGVGGVNAESSSTWFKWTCKTSGSLEFTITPLNKTDDIDFVLYELPNGLNNCENKNPIRCMAAGEIEELYPSDCHGPTGLRDGENDVSEPAGCQGSNNNFISPAQLEEGASYALAINNYSDSGNGFLIEWGGSAEFLGPEPGIEIIPTDNDYCYTDPLTFIDSSTNNTGEIVSWDWYFGENSIPQTTQGKGPHTVNYEEAGNKIIQLRIESDEGCVSTFVDTVELNCCGVPEVVDIGPDASYDLGETHQFTAEVDLKGTEYEYSWMPDSTLSCYFCPEPVALPIEEETTYTLRVEDEFGCSATDQATLFVNIEYPVYAPNAFSPNRDGVNDMYTLYSGIGADEIKRLEIYNKWGDRVFQRNNFAVGEEELGWDGKFRGERVDEGVYLFNAVVRFINGHEVELQGDITVFR